MSVAPSSETPAPAAGQAVEANGWAATPSQVAEHRQVTAASNGGLYSLRLSRPDGEAPPEGWPLLVVLDGESLFPLAADTVRRLGRRTDATGVKPAVVLGVGHPRIDDAPHDPQRRQTDYMAIATTWPESPARQGAPRPDLQPGGSAFAEFLNSELPGLLPADLPLDPAARFLFGHSMAGYFVLDIAGCHPDAFAAFGAASPSIWWNPDHLIAPVAVASEPGEIATPRIFIGVGEQEQRADAPPDDRRAQRRLIDNARQHAQALAQALPPGHVAFRIHAEEDHASVVAPALSAFLRHAFGDLSRR